MKLLKRKKKIAEEKSLNETPQKPYLSIKELAKETGVSEYYIRNLISEGKIPYLTAGKKFLINYNGFMEFLESESLKNLK